MLVENHTVTILCFATGSFSLSVRDSDGRSGETVKHYKIRTLDSGGFYISPRNTFGTLQELVSHYKSELPPQSCVLTYIHTYMHAYIVHTCFRS